MPTPRRIIANVAQWHIPANIRRDDGSTVRQPDPEPIGANFADWLDAVCFL